MVQNDIVPISQNSWNNVDYAAKIKKKILISKAYANDLKPVGISFNPDDLSQKNTSKGLGIKTGWVLSFWYDIAIKEI